MLLYNASIFWFAYSHCPAWPYPQSVWWPSRGGHSVENLLGSVNTQNLVCAYIGSVMATWGTSKCCTLSLMPYIPHKSGFGFPVSWQWKHLPVMLPIRELAATLKSGFWQKGIFWGVLLLWNYNLCSFNSIQLYWNQDICWKPTLIVWNWQNITPLSSFRGAFQSLWYVLLPDTLLWNVSHSLKSLH